jgi:hypothetical protein
MTRCAGQRRFPNHDALADQSFLFLVSAVEHLDGSGNTEHSIHFE